MLNERNRLKLFIENLFKLEKKKLCSLAYIFCSDEHLLTINSNFLKHDFYTDVITFDLSSSKNKIVGEVYLSVDRIRDNAKQLGVSTDVISQSMGHANIAITSAYLKDFEDDVIDNANEKLLMEPVSIYHSKYETLYSA